MLASGVLITKKALFSLLILFFSSNRLDYFIHKKLWITHFSGNTFDFL